MTEVGELPSMTLALIDPQQAQAGASVVSTLSNISGSGPYPPHGFCLMWNTDLIALELLGNGGIALAYCLIPVMMVYSLRRFRPQTPMAKCLVIEFAAFIFCCAISHMLHMATLYVDLYWAEAIWANITGFVSLMTAVTLPFAIRRFVKSQTTAAVKKVIQDPHNALDSV